MINPKELRIGNYVFDKGWEAARPIGATDIYDMVIKGSENYDPIELTPEWLIKLGFKKQSDGFWFLSGGYYVIEGKDGWHLSIGGGLLSKVVIKSIHQLQNYYFVHQNKELELKNN